MWQWFRPWLGWADSEWAHRWAIRGLAALPWAIRPRPLAPRIGLAAGFDKNAEILVATARMGFGFTEIGTVTPRPQMGNPRPRMWRSDRDLSLFNRMGFNNDGAEVVSARVRNVRDGGRLPPEFKIGVSVGKNKDTPLENAAADYRIATRAFRDLIDTLVINVSSPNTEQLRSLQAAEALVPLVEEVRAETGGWHRVPRLWVKLAPELAGPGLADLMVGLDSKVDGFVLTNTLAGTRQGQSGGWSGSPLTVPSRAALIQARPLTKKTLVSVGGILDSTEAHARFHAGADLIQIYSALVFTGLNVVNDLQKQKTPKA